MSERDRSNKGPFGRPAARAEGRRPDGDRRGPYGKPAPRPQGERPAYGRPAQPGSKPGDKRSGPYGRPAPKPQEGDRPAFGRPVPKPQGDRPAFGRPAPRPQGDKSAFGRPAPRPQEGDRPAYGRPAPRPQGDKPAFGRPAPKPQGERPAPSGRPAFGRPAFGRPQPGGKPGMARPGFARPKPEAPSITSDARKGALDVLNRVLLAGGYASLSLDEAFQQLRLSFKDRRLCTQIVYLTLENLNKLDFALNRLMEAPERLDKRVRNLLRLSAAQILLLDRVPDSAVVNEAVKITRDMELEELTGLVNGILRNLIRQMDDIPWPKPEDGLIYYEVMHSQPQWLAAKVLSQYGQVEGDLILRHQSRDHAVTIRRNTSRISRDAFEALLGKKRWTVEPAQLPDAWKVKGALDIGRDEDFLQGYFSVQGEGSMMAAMALNPKLGSQVLDCCAAPGGKTALISEHMQGTGRIQAWDLHAHRVDLVSAMAQRLRLYNIRPAMRDALVLREQLKATMDYIIIDAPCTGTGVMGEKPDIRLRLTEEGLQELTLTQANMLDIVSQYLKPGGILVYATCSILAEENERQVARFLQDHPAFQMVALPDSIPEKFRDRAGPHGLQLLPHRDHTEGFFIARMQLK